MADGNRTTATVEPIRSALSGDDAQKLRRMETLLNVSRQVAAIESLDEVLETLVGILTLETGAERSSLFLNDIQTGELYSRIAQGTYHHEIRILNSKGIAGHVYTTGNGLIISDAYSDDRFDSSIDKRTGFITRNILCAPIKTVTGEVIGVVQTLNKKDGDFKQSDLQLLEEITTQAAITLQSRQFVERMRKSREQEMEFLDVVSDVASELELKPLLQKIMNEARRLLRADRATLFLNDEKTDELWSEVGTGLNMTQIRFPNHLGIAGAVFRSGKTVNIPYAYADLRFNPTVDKKTGYFTRSILCVPVINKFGKSIGVTQVLNKQGGPFNQDDETRLKAFSAKISLGLENAKLFADIQDMKNYNESVLESMSNSVITVDESGKIVTCNAAGMKILNVESKDIVDQEAKEFFSGTNEWILEKIERVEKSQVADNTVDAALEVAGEQLSVNVTIVPLISVEHKKLGTMVMIEDISSEKRLKSTMARYVDPALADKLLDGGGDMLGGKNAIVTVLFSDVRSFTTMTEKLGAQGTVSLLNEYFTIMVECLNREGGMLDKFIGDAIMAAFGIPVPHDDDEDRAVRTAIAMLTELREFNAPRLANGEMPVNIGIGLNTDRVVSGNIGSPKRMDYTIMGDGVNLAARLESACKQYFAKILVSENTYNKLEGSYRAREIDKVIVKGKTKPIAVYELLEYHDEETFPNMADVIGCFDKGVNQYRRGDWDLAIRSFREALRANPDDKVSQMYVDRCEKLKATSPGDDWNGVWVMTEK
ncbi:GAF domain-containing protein [Planctomycetota bacterium]